MSRQSDSWFVPCLHDYSEERMGLRQVGKKRYKTVEGARKYLKNNHLTMYRNCEWSVVLEEEYNRRKRE